jgi:GNAT superfamily N-acetyltransferase
MTEADVAAVHAVSVLAFEDLARRGGHEPEPRPDPAVAHIRIRHVLGTDPGGSWVAESGDGILGCALGIVREGVWGLSLLVVRPDAQSAGLGRALLARAHAYGDGARGRIILASPDPRALRAYARLGLTAHPCLWARGVPLGVTVPPGVRPGTLADLPLTEAVDREVRGAAHGQDIAALVQAGAKLLVAPSRGYALHKGGELKLLAARDEDAARELLQAALAAAGEEKATVDWLTAGQDWAVPVCLDARLELRGDAGAVFLGGDVGRFRPYLPSGAYL